MSNCLGALSGLVLTAGICWAAPILAQDAASGGGPAPVDPASLEEAVGLFEQGKIDEAANLLAQIRESGGGVLSESALNSARCYEALCSHSVGDFHLLMELLEPLDSGSFVVVQEIREELAWARIDGLFYFRKFEKIPPAIEAFRAEHPGSRKLGALIDYELATHFERGLKKTLEGVQSEGEKADDRLADGRDSLERFLSAVEAKSVGQYTSLLKRSLRDDQWTARVILGEEGAIMDEIADSDPEIEEDFRLLCALLFPRIRPDQADENLEYIARFRADFPGSKGWPRVELEMAGIALREGERVVQVSGQDAAKGYFDFSREWYGRVVQDGDSGVDAEGVAEPDVWDAREGMLRVSFWQKDYAALSTWIDYFIAMTEPGEKRWRQAKFFDALADVWQGKLSEASPTLDEVLAAGFTGHPGHDGVTIEAMRWRVFAAMRSGDQSGVQTLIQMVRESECEESIKAPFLEEYAWVGE